MKNKTLYSQFYNGIYRKNTNSIKWDLLRKEEEYYPFWVADSDYQTVDQVIQDLTKRVAHGTFGYCYIHESYFETIQAWFQKRYAYTIEKEDIIPTHSVLTALSIFIRTLTAEEDEIVISTPVYPQFFNVIQKNNRKIVENKLIQKNERYELDFEKLDQQLATAKMYILCNPHNPVGRVWRKEELDRLVWLCQKHQCYLISDEIHADIILGQQSFYSIGHYLNDYDRIGICTAPSKTFNIAGLKIANTIIRNSIIKEAYKNYQEELFISEPNLLALVACQSAYQNGEEWVEEQNEYLQENRDMVVQYFKENMPQATIYLLEGTYLMWIDLSYLNWEQDVLLRKIKEVNLEVNDGTTFSKDYKGFIRFNIATTRKNLLEGLKRLKDVLHNEI